MNEVFRWSAKALRKLDGKVSPEERLVFTGPKSALLYQDGKVLATGLYKSRDSFVVLTDETVPTGMEYDPKLDQAPTSPGELPKLAERFGFEI